MLDSPFSQENNDFSSNRYFKSSTNKSSHGIRTREKVQQPQLPDYYFDCILNEQNLATEVVGEFLEELVTKCHEIIHYKYLQSQIVKNAANTISRELIMTASWAYAPLDQNIVLTDADEDLEIPPIDEWAGGVLPVRDAEATGLRTAVNPEPEIKKQPRSARKVVKPPPEEPKDQGKRTPSSARVRTTTAATGTPIASSGNRDGSPKKKPKPPPTEADTILRTFEEARKKSNMTMKAVTVDAFTIIQITEPHGLPPSLIVPKVATKKIVKPEKPTTAITRAPRPSMKKVEQPKRKIQPKLIENDVPKFDNELAELTYADKFICSPGVTFRDGNAVKTRPPQNNVNQLTRAQYDLYLEDMKKSTEV